MNDREIYDDLVTTLHDDVLVYSTMILWLRQEQLPGFPNQAILSGLTSQRFGLVRDIARLTCLSCFTIHSCLTRSLRFRICHRRCIPHVLTQEQKLNQVRDSQVLLKMLQAQQRRSWHDIVTLDDLWFYLNTDHERIWLAPGETDPIESVHHPHQSESAE
jgi:hypothetical protein